MAMAHPPVTHEQSVTPGNKPVTSAVKRQFVPIRPAFRPLLPKPTPKESTPSNGIHIHTRAMLNSGRKRASASGKSDPQKRRKNYSIPALSSPKLTRTDPVDIPASALSRKLGNVSANQNSSVSSPSLPTPTSLNTSLVDEMRRCERTDSLQDGGRGYATPLSSTGTLSPTDRYTSFPPSELSFKKSDFSTKAATASPHMFDSLSSSVTPGGSNTTTSSSAISISSSGFDDQAAPATPTSISESPTSVSTASIFGTREDSTPNGTVNPTIILGENEEFGLDNTAASSAASSTSMDGIGASSLVASSLSENALSGSDFESGSLGATLSLNAAAPTTTTNMSALNQLDPLDEASLTPPSTQKNGGGIGMGNPAFSSLGMSEFGVFDDDFYFRTDDTYSGAESKGPTTNISSSGPAEPVTATSTSTSSVLAFDEPRGSEFSMDREDDFSFLDYLAPAPGEAL